MTRREWLDNIYKTTTVLCYVINLNPDNIDEMYRLTKFTPVEMRAPRKGEWYLSSMGVAKRWIEKDAPKRVEYVRLILREYPDAR